MDTRQVFQNELGEITPLEELLIILFMEELDKCYGERKDCLMETILSIDVYKRQIIHRRHGEEHGLRTVERL